MNFNALVECELLGNYTVARFFGGCQKFEQKMFNMHLKANTVSTIFSVL